MPSSAALRREAPALCGVLLLVLVAWAPVVFGSRSVAHYDLFYQHVPFRAFVARAQAQGELPLWAPGMRGGYPLHANGEAGLLSPVEAPLRLLGWAPHRASDAAFVLGSLLAAGFAHAFGRTLGMGRAAAALTGLAWGLSGRVVAAAWPNAAVVAGLAPALLLALERARRAPAAPGSAVAVALAVGALLLAGRPQSLLPLALIAVVPVLQAAIEGRARAVALGLVLGVGLGAPQALPTLALVQDSVLVAGLGPLDRAWGSVTAANALQLVVASGTRLDWPEARAHVGVVTLALALAGLGLALRGGLPRVALGYSAAALLAALLALGPATPLFELAGGVPFVGSARVPARYLLGFSLGVAVLAGLALHALVRGRRTRVALALLVGAELVGSAWATIPWAPPALYEATPRMVAVLRALPRDASGAVPRFLGAVSFPGYAGIIGTDGRGVVERDALGGNRALAFDLLSAAGYGEPVAAWQEHFAPEGARRMATLGVRVSVSPGPPRRLLGHDAVLPRALVVPHAVAARGPAEARALLEAVDPGRVAIVEGPVSPPAADFEPRPAAIEEASANRVVVRAEAPAAGWLVLHDAWDAGWTARVNGQAVAVRRAHGFFRAVPLPPGRAVVEFSYWPVGLTEGLAAATLASLALVGLALAARQRPRS
ncbi:MAG: YfhO family protein [Vicinamibacteria bacterium]|nr:YfhO family protein [Vicinamibacteria bacterium]